MNEDRLPQPYASIWDGFLEAYKTTIDRFNRMYQEAGVAGLIEHEVTGRLAHAPDYRLRVQDLADLLLVSKSGASRIIDRMEKQGLVRREKSYVDRRVVFAVLTDKGEEALHVSRRVWRDAFKEYFTDIFSDEELEQFRSLMARLTAGKTASGQTARAEALSGTAGS